MPSDKQPAARRRRRAPLFLLLLAAVAGLELIAGFDSAAAEPNQPRQASGRRPQLAATAPLQQRQQAQQLPTQLQANLQAQLQSQGQQTQQQAQQQQTQQQQQAVQSLQPAEASRTRSFRPARRPRFPQRDAYVILGFNDLGMHCMNEDFSQLCILPPFNTLHAQVIQRRREPRIIDAGVEVKYRIPGNTTSVTKTNFWEHDVDLFGVDMPADVGLTGSTLEGSMTPTGDNDWSVVGVPLTPITDSGALNAYKLAEISVESQGQVLAITHAVAPVSWEISCNLCHEPGMPGPMVDADILAKHDAKHNTQLLGGPSVLCASCHFDPALGTPGVPGVSSLSEAMHASHAGRMQPVFDMGLTNECYACHPGFETNCQRDVHFAKGIFCDSCHGDMAAVGDPTRIPWVDEPTCGGCHKAMQPEFHYEEPGKLFKESRGHGGVLCASCHGSPHAVGPAVTPQDNVQAIALQGHAGPLNECTVCHTTRPGSKFEHHFDD
ncbi:hypothetical protein Pla123a_08920 [Posidoniimonas polymericola]|uniref:Uncharacterized protein n=1 Tax=Posidoniimonas polymericola TaxID=2528002 RepID=A0A5C5YTU8_9BACT|nr:hypothetical protein [Posidoniimonas polymericola]TWT78103.1 hypothetical protein Pla123a_08920 [Posidoniimonas polymericola]